MHTLCPHCHQAEKPIKCEKCNRQMCANCIHIHPMGLLCGLCVDKLHSEFIARACRSHDDLLQAVKDAKKLIRKWHCMGMDGIQADICWDIYDKSAPEMKSINAAIEKAAYK